MFKIARDLGESDPIAWAKRVDPVILDRWYAFYLAEHNTRNRTETMAQARDRMTRNIQNG